MKATVVSAVFLVYSSFRSTFEGSYWMLENITV